MKIKVLFISFLFLMAGQVFAQHKDRDEWKHRKEYHKKEMEWQQKHGKKIAKHHREMQKKEQEHYRKLAKYEREYYRELRKREIEHLEECHTCNHAFYHNDDYYYEDNIYYSRRTRSPITVDAEVLFRNGSIRVQL